MAVTSGHFPHSENYEKDKNMKHLKVRSLLATAAIILAFAESTFSQGNTPPKITTIDGLVRDLSCPIQNPNAKAKDFDLKCAVECARAGSPLIIQTKDDLFYIPISGETPDKSQHERLMPFVGKYVRVTGQVFERGGTRAIAIQDIEALSSNE